MIQMILKYLDWQFDYTGMRWLVSVAFVMLIAVRLINL
jgi:hypothetical protein